MTGGARREEIEALLADGATTGAIAASLDVPHSEVVRVRKNMMQRARDARGRRPRSDVARANKRDADRVASIERTDARHARRAAAMAEESLYRKVARMRRERVVELLAAGKTQSQIAADLDVGLTTVNEIVMSLEGRRGWRRKPSVQVLMDQATYDRVRARCKRGEVSGWVLRIIAAELDRIDVGDRPTHPPSPEADQVRRRIGRPSAAPPLLGLTYERVAELVEGRVNATTSRAARRWLRGLADMGAVRAVRLADAAGIDLGELVRELARRRQGRDG